MMGICSRWSGRQTFLPMRWAHLPPGFTARATSAMMVSGRVVATVRKVEGGSGKEEGAGGGGFFDQLVLHVVEGAFLLGGDDFLVGEGGEGAGVPVDHAGAAVDVAFV